MKLAHVILLLLFAINCKAQTNNIDTIRKAYLEAAQSEVKIIKLINTCEKYKSKKNSITYAYRTVADLMQIKYKHNPLYKLKLFTYYSAKLDLIVTNNFNNIEIRFLRYCVQKQTPIFLDYNDNLELDYQFIMENIDIQTKELQKYIRSTLKSL